MVDIRPNQLPPLSPLEANDVVIVDQGADGVRQGTSQQIVDFVAPVVTQAEAIAGSDNVKRMTALRVKQSIASEVGISIASNAQGTKADSAVQSVNGKSGNAVTLVKGDVGLGNVDNTSDANKPVSTATQSALDLKANSSVTISAGAGLIGGGDLSANRTFNVGAGSGISVTADAVALSASSIASLAKADSSVQTVNGVPPVNGDVSVDANLNTTQFNPDVTGVSSPYISVSEFLKTGLNASSIKMVGDGTSDNYDKLQGVINDISSWGGGMFRIDRQRENIGVYNLSNSINLPPNVYIVGDGMGVVSLKSTGNFPVIVADGTISSVRRSGGVSDLTIIGGGKSLSNANGIVLDWVNRYSFSNLQFFSCRNAISYGNVWQVILNNINIDGAGADQNYRGLFAREVDPTNPNNAVIANGIMVQNVEEVGFRLINYNGSKFVNCELAGSGSHGWHLGAPSLGTEEIRWGHFSNCLSDTTGGDGLRVEKGSSSDSLQTHFSNFWIGTSGGVGLNVFDTSSCTFTGIKIASTYNSAVSLTRTSRVNIVGFNIDNYGISGNSDPAILLDSSSRNVVSSNVISTQAIGAGAGIQEAGSSSDNTVIGNDVGGGGAVLSQGCIASSNIGYRTTNQGGADILTSQNSVVVNHGIDRLPLEGEISVYPVFNLSSVGVSSYWIDNINSTSFTINISNNPSSNIRFGWRVDSSRG